MKRLLLLTLGLTMIGAAKAQEEKLEIKPSGRILLDGGLFKANEQDDKFNDGFAIPDMRVGFSASYGAWKAKVDMGYAYGKVNMKDVFIQYNFDKDASDFLRAGYFIHQFGLQSATSSSFKISMEEPASNQAFNNSRMIGLMYQHTRSKFLGTLSFFTESDAMKMTSDKLGNQGVGMMTRLVYKPFCKPGKIFHVGLSGAFETPRYDSDAELSHHAYTLSTTFPTRIAKVVAQEAVIDDAKMLYKFTPELNAAIGRIGLETQYFYVNVNRKDKPNYKASGAYGTIRALVKGKNYKYSDLDGGIATPDPGAMEVVLSYNYTDMSDHKAEILGGRLNDWSATFNYYINKYMIWRVRGSYTTTTDRINTPNTKLALIETRLQIKF